MCVFFSDTLSAHDHESTQRQPPRQQHAAHLYSGLSKWLDGVLQLAVSLRDSPGQLPSRAHLFPSSSQLAGQLQPGPNSSAQGQTNALAVVDGGGRGFSSAVLRSVGFRPPARRGSADSAAGRRVFVWAAALVHAALDQSLGVGAVAPVLAFADRVAPDAGVSPLGTIYDSRHDCHPRVLAAGNARVADFQELARLPAHRLAALGGRAALRPHFFHRGTRQRRGVGGALAVEPEQQVLVGLALP